MTSRYRPSSSLLYGCLYVFHLLRCRKSMKSFCVSTFWFFILKVAMCAISHNIALCFCGGHSLNCGRTVHSLGIYFGSIRIIMAVLRRIHSHVTSPSPQSVILCTIVSVLVHILHLSVFDRRILCNLSFVGNSISGPSSP
jgi:hypothetical protein